MFQVICLSSDNEEEDLERNDDSGLLCDSNNSEKEVSNNFVTSFMMLIGEL